MKKIILIVLGLALLAGLGLWSNNLIENKGKSLETGLFNFAIEDTASIDKIIITDLNSNSYEVLRNGNSWTDKDGACILQENVQNILNVAKNIEFKGYLPENAVKKTINQMSAIALKVDFYQNGSWSKSWYIGTASQDHYGQIMLLDSRQDGKSDQPVLMKVKGVNGIIEPNFIVDPRKWICTNIFALSVDEIKRVEVINYKDPARSFSIDKNKSSFEVKQNGFRLPAIDTLKAYRYLQNFKKVNFYIPNFMLSDKQVDSVKHSKPFGSLKVTETNNKTTLLKFFSIQGAETFDSEFGEVTNMDLNNFWCLLPSQQLVKCQFYVFDPLTRGDIYFPFDTRNYKKGAIEIE
jgi:hypothetical protein